MFLGRQREVQIDNVSGQIERGLDRQKEVQIDKRGFRQIEGSLDR